MGHKGNQEKGEVYMKRVLVALVLVLAMFSTTVASAAPATPAGEYWEDLKAMYEEWTAMEGTSDMKITVTLPEEDPMVFDVNIKSFGNMEDMSASMEMTIATEDPELQIPVIHMMTVGSDIYLNTEIIKFLAEKMEMGDMVQIEEEYVMLQGGEGVPEVSSQYLMDILEFVEDMDLDFEFDITKEGDTYTLNMDSDQMIDLFDAYMVFSMENSAELMELSGQEMEFELTEEEIQEALAMYEEVFAPMLETAREAIKGSYYNQVTTITDEAYDEEAELYITSPMGNIMVEMVSSTERLDEYTLELPESVKVYTQDDLTNLLIGSMGLPEGGRNLAAMLDVDQDMYMIITETEVIEGEVEITLTQEGLSYMSVKDAVEIFGLQMEPSEELMHIRELDNHGYDIEWNQQLRMIEVYVEMPEPALELPMEESAE
jgi:predicted HTH domain antitoxin